MGQGVLQYLLSQLELCHAVPHSRSADEADNIPQKTLQVNQLEHLCTMLSYDPAMHCRPGSVAQLLQCFFPLVLLEDLSISCHHG